MIAFFIFFSEKNKTTITHTRTQNHLYFCNNFSKQLIIIINNFMTHYEIIVYSSSTYVILIKIMATISYDILFFLSFRYISFLCLLIIQDLNQNKIKILGFCFFFVFVFRWIMNEYKQRAINFVVHHYYYFFFFQFFCLIIV